jgi:hypothetical protein
VVANPATKRRPQARFGKCKLTGVTGRYVEAHLIPKSLTRPSGKGVPFIQGGKGERPGYRWGGWYDPCLVVQKGENILTALDTWAIPALRKNELIWSGWKSGSLTTPPVQIGPDGRGVRQIVGLDRDRLRLFFLSLLWRAAATDRPEFAEVTIPEADLERLRQILLANDPAPLSFYPAVLCQLSTKGPTQNLSPFASTNYWPIENMTPRSLPIFRFFFDGLIAWIINDASADEIVTSGKHIVVGYDSTLLVPTVVYEGSFQMTNAIKGIRETAAAFPMDVSRML